MVLITKTKTGITVTWIDGYLPPREHLARNIKNYQSSKPEFSTKHLDYEPTNYWSREEIFKSGALIITSDLHGLVDSKETRPPCSVWLAKLHGVDNLHIGNIAAETKRDTRREDYFHVISVHSAEEAQQCITHLLDNVGFEVKDNGNYHNLEAFHTECESSVYRILEIFSDPLFAIDDILQIQGFDISRYTR